MVSLGIVCVLPVLCLSGFEAVALLCVCVCVQKSTRTSRYQSLSFPHTLRMARERFVSCKPSVQNVFSNQHLLECLFNVLKH